MNSIEILNKAKESYNKIIDFHLSSGYDTNLSSIWLNNLPDINNIINNSNNAEEVMDLVDKTFMYSINFHK